MNELLVDTIGCEILSMVLLGVCLTEHEAKATTQREHI